MEWPPSTYSYLVFSSMTRPCVILPLRTVILNMFSCPCEASSVAVLSAWLLTSVYHSQDD